MQWHELWLKLGATPCRAHPDHLYADRTLDRSTMTPPPSSGRPEISRTASSSAKSRQDPKAAKPEAEPSPQVHYTVFIRCPFPRGDFVDPPPVDWDAAKDRALWRILSNNPKSSSLDWEQLLSTTFQVSLPFLLQQAAWLYERQLSQVRAQMRKVAAPSAPSPVPGSVGSATMTSGGAQTRRLESGGEAGAARPPSATLLRSKNSPALRGEESFPSSPRRSGVPPLSRNPSTNTVTQSRHLRPKTPTQGSGQTYRSSFPPSRKPEKALDPTTETSITQSPRTSSPGALSSESSSSSDSDPAMPPIRRSQIFRRPPQFSARTPLGIINDGSNADAEAEDEDSPTFLPFANPQLSTVQEAALKSRADQRRHEPGRRTSEAARTDKDRQAVESSASSVGSVAQPPSLGGDGTQSGRQLHSLSPRHRAELARLSPRQRGLRKEGSEGTPSMGSSFSDLDDTSVTQSALEEALLSNIQRGGMASRMSSLSQALRSRYL